MESFGEDFSINEIVYKDETDKERKEKLVKAMNQLSPRQKETLFLRYYHGLSNDEIAEVMEINHQSVKNNLSRAVQKLRDILNTGPSSMVLLLLNTLPKWM